MTLIDPRSSPFNRPGETPPRAYDNCQCQCHRISGVYHVMACCGIGASMFKFDHGPSDEEVNQVLADISAIINPAPEGVPMAETQPDDLKAKLDMILEFSDQIAAVKALVNRVQELTPEEVTFLKELLVEGTQAPSLPEEVIETKVFRLGDKVTYDDPFKALCYPFSFGTRFYKDAIVACLKPFVLVANPDSDQTVARWTHVNPKDLKVVGKSSDGEFIRTRKSLSEEELVSTGETTRLEV